MEDHEQFCGHCGTESVQKKENVGFKIFESGIKGFVFIFFLIPSLFVALIAFPFGLLALIFPASLYYAWWGAGKNLEKCRCCGKQISKEAHECPKCGCPRPTN